jgi:hypothetical protein
MNLSLFLDKRIEELDNSELIEVFLIERNEPIQFKYDEVRTTLSMTLEGVKENLKKLSTRNLLPIMGVFSVFDILGSSFNNTEKTTNVSSSIKRCLNLFVTSQLNKDDIEALYALRNSIVHNSSLISITKNENKKSYYFRYNSNLSTLLKHAESDWNGDFEELSGNQDKYTSEINIFKLNDLMQECLSSIRVLNQSNKIELRYSGLQEFYYHYFRSIKNKFSSNELEKLKPKFIEKKELIEKHIAEYSKFKTVILGDNDSYSLSKDEKQIEIASHQNKLLIQELKLFLDREFFSNKKHQQKLSLFYKTSDLNSLKYRLIIIV